MTRATRARLFLALRIVIALVAILLCGHLIRQLDLDAVLQALRRASLPLVALAAVVNITQVWFRAIAWSLMLSPVAKVPVRRLFRYNLVAFAASNLLPARSGDLIRIGLLRTKEGIALTTLVAASFVEKCAEALTLLLLALPLPWIIPGLPQWVSMALIGLGSIGSLGLVVAWIGSSDLAQRWRWLARFKDGTVIVRRRRVFLTMILVVLIEGLIDASTLFIVLRALDIQVHWAAPILLEVSLNMAIMLPSTPAHVGAFEMGLVLGLGLLGVDRESALAFALVYHAMELVPVTLLGVAGLFAGSRDVQQAEESLTDPDQDAASTSAPGGNRWQA